MEAFIKEEHLTAGFYDFQKVYDTTCKFGILKDFHELDLKGRLSRFIENFLEDRIFQVRIGTKLSEHKIRKGFKKKAVFW